jgi:NAD(P)-dependent dehydrogenase (short-subunit alcohol dehydrogenase family)
MDLDVVGKRAIVTGASRGIGLAIARTLSAEGVQVVAASRTGSTELKDLVATHGAVAVEVDLTSEDGPAQLVDAAVKEGPVSILVNNAGAVTPRPNGSTSVTDDQWWQSLNLVLMTAVRITRAVVPHMISAGGGVIINNASVNATLPDPLVIDYSAAKAALLNYSKSLSKELGPHNIRVNSISPGPVATDLWLGEHGVAATLVGAKGGRATDYEESAVRDTATKRFTTPQEVADLVVFLASPRAGNITGVDYLLDGGLTQTV